MNLFSTELFAKPDDEKPIWPKQLIDVDGKTVDLAKLANGKKLFYSNLKKQRGALFVLSNCSDSSGDLPSFRFVGLLSSCFLQVRLMS